MCVGVPGKVIEKFEYSAVVDVMGSQTTVGIIFVPEVELGEYVDCSCRSSDEYCR